MTAKDAMIPTATVAQRILLLRGQKVIVDADLAELYGVETKALNQAVKRNRERFPLEFMFQLRAPLKIQISSFRRRPESSVFNQLDTGLRRCDEFLEVPLSKAEKDEVVTNCDHLARLKYSPVLPYAFTEHGSLMLGNVLKSPRAIEVSLLIVKTFVQVRELLASNKDLKTKLEALERKLTGHDHAILEIVEAIKQLMAAPRPSGRSIGFTADLSGAKSKP